MPMGDYSYDAEHAICSVVKLTVSLSNSQKDSLSQQNVVAHTRRMRYALIMKEVTAYGKNGSVLAVKRI